jgi:hypothetical protein
MMILAGSLIMIGGAVAISMSEAPESEQDSWRTAMESECSRYGLDRNRVAAAVQGRDPLMEERPRRRWWEFAIAAAAVVLFIWLAVGAERQPLAVSIPWMAGLIVASLALLIGSGFLLWKRTRFS